jgi:hypothetical protein
VALTERFRRRRAEQAGSLGALARKALAEAEAALARKDIAAVAGGVERAVYLSLEAGFGIRGRAFLRGELAAALDKGGVDGAVVNDVAALLDDCDGLRFGGAAVAPAVVVERARAATNLLLRGRGVRGKS